MDFCRPCLKKKEKKKRRDGGTEGEKKGKQKKTNSSNEKQTVRCGTEHLTSSTNTERTGNLALFTKPHLIIFLLFRINLETMWGRF